MHLSCIFLSVSATARKIAAWSINADAYSLIHSSSFLLVLVGGGGGGGGGNYYSAADTGRMRVA